MESFEKINVGAGIFTKKDGINLESLYSQCNGELTLQQSKRDQIIAVYISVAGFIIPSILGLGVGMLSMAAAFLLMYVIGDTLCKVVVRYRIYKEVYWITSRTIATLFSVDSNLINKHLVQKLFADNIRRGRASVIVLKDGFDDKVGTAALETPVSYSEAVDQRATVKKISNSAETLLYKLMALMSAATLTLATFFAAKEFLPLLPILTPKLQFIIASCIAFVAGILVYVKEKNFYITKLTDVYAYCFDGKKESFNATYAKAWFLHGFQN